MTIRSVDDRVKSAVRLEAARNGRSMEAELRALLERTYLPPNDRAAWLHAMSPQEAIDHLIKMANGADLVIPEREAEDFEFPDL
ncbi:FitA-like ribbon-helix-helix domain-containing protein [Sphingomonas trueperi]|uniref:FitA-like ribbon-helix-helix domain-containing protein n=1 Tax=Sphingomonas trueperi TaxID=53317 RepID=UPI000F7F066F|nr:plasmid stabilization protein [Sphingomonas trueperi]